MSKKSYPRKVEPQKGERILLFDMAKLFIGALIVVLLTSAFSRVIPTKHDLIVVDNPMAEEAQHTSEDDEDFYDPSLGPFIPTKEWQVVKRGQRIPAGLHVRLNFQTKVREAKLMEDEGDTKSKKASHIENDNKRSCSANENCSGENTSGLSNPSDPGPIITTNSEGKVIQEFEHNGSKLFFTKSQLKDAVQEFKDNLDASTPDDVQGLTRKRKPSPVRKEFKTMEEIRGEIKEAYQFHKKSEAEVVMSYLDVLQRKNSTNQEKEVALEDLEYLCHELSSAQDMAKMGGFKVIVHYINQSKNEVLQEKAAKVFAAAVQSNPSAQDAALASNAVPVLLQIISSTDILKLKKRTLYALSALLRGHFKSQKLFVKLYGLNVVLNLIKQEGNGNIRIQGLTLITDLALEQKEVLAAIQKNNRDAKNRRISIMPAMAKHGWCDALPSFLGSEDLDTLEKVLQAISVSKVDCKSKFKSGNVPELMKKVIEFIKDKYDSESDKDFKEYLGNLRDIAVKAIS